MSAVEVDSKSVFIDDSMNDAIEALRSYGVDSRMINELKVAFAKRIEECQFELEEFQESSRELEQELETQLTFCEKRNKELEENNARLQYENEALRSKLLKLSDESQRQILELQKELGESQASNERLTRCIRELEQSNDDLERAKRALAASLEDFEQRLNHQIERNVLLENELGEKEELEVVVQRLKDEARDLRSELMVQQQQPFSSLVNETRRSSCLPISNSNNNNNSFNLNKSRVPTTTTSLSSGTETPSTPNGTPVKQSRFFHPPSSLKNNSITPNSSPVSQQSLPMLSPSTRISALNIVSDLLRKVGALESKLASCRNIVPPGTPKNRSRVSSPLTSPSTLKDIGREVVHKE
ncbi:nuclear distribution protein nudE-like protein [Dinothrombium tinctorium]|uniref:Nuclear distribution protein nudE-like protein n=1 Tax=Dinothrombium tinctorium TaxID=1965070 RepID=A0A3S3QQ15_9ACAR|nr:nuclear distribution protein nudE-like protein [Dinothrombium tinctorium]